MNDSGIHYSDILRRGMEDLSRPYKEFYRKEEADQAAVFVEPS
jgi:hypothetical protein